MSQAWVRARYAIQEYKSLGKAPKDSNDQSLEGRKTTAAASEMKDEEEGLVKSPIRRVYSVKLMRSTVVIYQVRDSSSSTVKCVTRQKDYMYSRLIITGSSSRIWLAGVHIWYEADIVVEVQQDSLI